MWLNSIALEGVEVNTHTHTHTHTHAECSSKDSNGSLKVNSPIVIAWSGSGRNHFIPLVQVKGKPLPKLPPHLQPKVWGQDEAILKK